MRSGEALIRGRQKKKKKKHEKQTNLNMVIIESGQGMSEVAACGLGVNKMTEGQENWL